MTNSSSDMSLRGRIGGYARASKYNPEQLTDHARNNFLASFTPTDPDLSPEERERRRKAALNAHMAKLARLSAIRRKGRREKLT